MNFEEIVGDLSEAMSSYYEVSDIDEDTFLATYHNDGNPPEDMLWPVDDHEYAFVHVSNSLSEEDYNNVVKGSLEEGIELVKPGPNHRSSIILTIIVCNKTEKDFEERVKKYHFMKKFRLSIYGMSEHGLILIDASKKKLICNRTAKKAGESLKKMYGLK